VANKYNIVITATDAATAKIRAIKGAISGLVRPISDTARSAAALGKETGVDKIGRSFLDLSKNAAMSLKSVGGVGGALAGAVGAGSISAIAIWSKNWASANSQIVRTAASIGVTAQQIQSLEGAAKLAGLDPGAATGALGSLGEKLQGAQFSRAPEVLNLMVKMGMQFKRTKTGAIDTAASLDDLADKIANMRDKETGLPATVQTKALVANAFGVGDLLTMLLKGAAGMRALRAEADRFRPPLSDADLDKATAYLKKINELGLSFEYLGNAVTLGVGPTVGGWLDYWIARINATSVAMRKNGVGAQIGRNVLYNSGMAVTNLAQTVGKGETWAVKKVVSNVQDIGNLIGAGEGGYNSVNTGKRGGYKSAHTNLVESSIGSVMDAQKAGDFNAAGKYQLTAPVLAAAVKAMHLDRGAKFDQAMQERVFREYMLTSKRPEIGDYISGKSNDLHAALRGASREWASIQEEGTGRGHYDGVAGNHATIPAAAVAQALQAARAAQGAGAAAAGGGATTAVAQALQAARAAQGAGAAAAGGGATGLADVWTNSKPEGAHATVRIEIPHAPPGTKAEVVGARGPVTTELKVEHSMPDFSL
jgi:hypothetical protein